MGFKSGIWLGHSRHLSWSHSSLELTVCFWSFSYWKMNLAPVCSCMQLEQVLFKGLSVFGCILSSLNSNQSPCLSCWETPPQYDACPTLFHHRNSVSQLMNSKVWNSAQNLIFCVSFLSQEWVKMPKSKHEAHRDIHETTQSCNWFIDSGEWILINISF